MQRRDQIVVSVAILVIDSHSPLQEGAKPGGIERGIDLRIIKRFGLIEQKPPVTVGAANQGVTRGIIKGEGAFQLFRARKQFFQSSRVQAIEDQNLRTAKQSCVEFKARIFGCCADQRNRPAARG